MTAPPADPLKPGQRAMFGPDGRWAWPPSSIGEYRLTVIIALKAFACMPDLPDIARTLPVWVGPAKNSASAGTLSEFTAVAGSYT